ncbi:MAG: murein biosynthesis integral membrane protein MurJ [Acidimicrobiia bacterium]|nr:murein biosynthesis integral membrane protein MurJ [Acidimicrobiia bacterium]
MGELSSDPDKADAGFDVGNAIEEPPVTPLRDEALAPSLLRSSAVVALGTALSRITGFGRLAATTYAIGLGRLTDAYTLANTAPNIVYELLLGGVLSATLVPVFVRQKEEGDDEGTSAVVSVTAVLLVAITVTGFIAAPAIVRLLTIGLPNEVAGEERQVATDLLRTFMPQMFFYGLTALFTALLNARRRFAAPAFAPAINNIIVSVVLLALPTLARRTPDLEQVRGDVGLLLFLGVGTTAGIVAMTLVLWPSLKRTGIRLRFSFDLRNRSVRQVGRMSGWTVGYVLANQIALLVVYVLANPYDGGVSAYTAAYVFFLLPHALFAVSIMTTLVPELSSSADRGDMENYRARFSLGIRLMMLVVLPAATGYAVLGGPIVGLLQHGALEGSEARLAGDALAAFGLGLPGFSVYLFTLRGFYALHDTKTPFLLNLAQNVVQIVLALVLERIFGVSGLALAYGGAYTLAAGAALVLLRARVGRLDGTRVARTTARIVAACAVLALAVLAVAGRVGSEAAAGALVRTTVGVAVGGLAYLAAVVALRVDEVVLLRDRLLRRARR